MDERCGDAAGEGGDDVDPQCWKLPDMMAGPMARSGLTAPPVTPADEDGDDEREADGGCG